MTMVKILDVTGIKKKSSDNGDGKPDYKEITIEAFESKFMKETSRKVLRAQYALLSDRVHELEAQLEEFKSKTA